MSFSSDYERITGRKLSRDEMIVALAASLRDMGMTPEEWDESPFEEKVHLLIDTTTPPVYEILTPYAEALGLTPENFMLNMFHVTGVLTMKLSNYLDQHPEIYRTMGAHLFTVSTHLEGGKFASEDYSSEEPAPPESLEPDEALWRSRAFRN